jgi:hypothetical protein
MLQINLHNYLYKKMHNIDTQSQCTPIRVKVHYDELSHRQILKDSFWNRII